MTDLLIINPGQGNNYKGFGDLPAIEPPLWAGMIAAFVRNHGYSVELWDLNAESFGSDHPATKAFYMNPKLIAVVVYGHNPSASTTVMPEAGRICRKIKGLRPNQKIVMVGGHVAALPLTTLGEEAVDHVCSGEGPYCILGLLRDEYCVERPVHNIDKEMPGVAWDLLPMDKYRAHNWHCFGMDRQPYASLYTSLGCPYSCEFCCIHAPFKNGPRYRTWSPESVIKQIDILVNTFGVKNIKFADELFVMNSDRVFDICDLLIERNYGLNIWAYCRVGGWTQNLLNALKSAGVNWLCLGIEQKGGKGGNPAKTVEAIHEAGINIIGNYMFGLPGDDLNSMKDTLTLALELNCEFANFYCTMAYPGSRLYDKTDPKDLPDSWEGYSQLSYECRPLPTEHLTFRQVLDFRDNAFIEYYRDERYLDMMEKKFGKEVRDHVSNLKPPKRRFLGDGMV